MSKPISISASAVLKQEPQLLAPLARQRNAPIHVEVSTVAHLTKGPVTVATVDITSLEPSELVPDTRQAD